jgi:predicted nucleic acid-binding protein
VGRPDEIRRALLDASALIGVVKGEAYWAPLRSLLDAIDRGEVTLVESTAILVEVRPAHSGDTGVHALARDTVRSLLESPETELVDVNRMVARKAGELADKHGLATWDAVHLATAILAKTNVMVARDPKLSEGYYEGVYVTGPFDLDDDKLSFPTF